MSIINKKGKIPLSDKKLIFLRSVPSVDALLKTEQLKTCIDTHGIKLVTYAVRKSIDSMRKATVKEKSSDVEKELVLKAKKIIRHITEPNLKAMINATGVVIHTNIGRTPLGEKLLEDIKPVLSGYSNLEFDLEKGKRGTRSDHIRELIKYITNSQDAVVVNNNAAAIILILNTLAKDKEVIISRGELIEIGGSFRINEIMAASGCKIVEVGTTNKTRLSDYEAAVTPQTALIFKVHKSNYVIKGFTEETTVKELAEFSRKKNIPFVYDIGSGLLHKPANLDLGEEPDVRSALKDGASLVCFSADKLLGGPQAGIVVGEEKLISCLAKAPLMRALRVGKMTLAALSVVCRAYLNDELLMKNIPIFSVLSRKAQEIKTMCEKLKLALKNCGISTRIIENIGQCGGGTLPELKIPSFTILLELSYKDRKNNLAQKIFSELLKLEIPILGILRKGNILFDLLTVEEKDVPIIASAVEKVYAKIR